MYAGGTGIILVPDTGEQVTDVSALGIGDLLFFDASDDDQSRLDHVGMYLGIDTAGAHRFISSRKAADGPTFADKGGASILDGSGDYAEAFRAARRL